MLLPGIMELPADVEGPGSPFPVELGGPGTEDCPTDAERAPAPAGLEPLALRMETLVLDIPDCGS